MIEQRLQQRLRVLLVAPVALILIVVALAITTAQTPGTFPREVLFDTFQRMSPRAAMEEPAVAIIDIDEESLSQIGPWPWPRTTLAGLVAAAHKAEAASVVVTVPVDGTDPLSPEVVTQFWQAVPGSDDAVRAIAQMPTNNAALAAAAATAKTSLSIGRTPDLKGGWDRTDVAASPWLSLTAAGNTGYIALPSAPVFGEIDGGLAETSMISIGRFPHDPDGTVRRTSLLWSVNEQPSPTAALAGLILVEGALGVTASDRRLRVDGPPPSLLSLG
ncbi:MAG: CHASE2 domain-containing protein, partial [Pseudomonadota bacterium]